MSTPREADRVERAAPRHVDDRPVSGGRRIAAYAGLAYAITWALWIPALVYSASTGWALPSLTQGPGAWIGLTTVQLLLSVCLQLAVYGPALAAIIMLARVGSRRELSAWARSIVRFDVPFGWYAFVFLAPLTLAAVVTILGRATGGQLVLAGIPTLGALVTSGVAQTLTSGMEEPGWRGFALPLLQRGHTAENASWYLGLIWAGWHLPYMLYLYRGLPAWQLPLVLAGFTMSIVAMGYVHAWLYNSTGSVAMNVLLHGWANTTNAIVAVVVLNPLVPLATAGVTWIFEAWLFSKYGRQTLSTRTGAGSLLGPAR